MINRFCCNKRKNTVSLRFNPALSSCYLSGNPSGVCIRCWCHFPAYVPVFCRSPVITRAVQRWKYPVRQRAVFWLASIRIREPMAICAGPSTLPLIPQIFRKITVFNAGFTRCIPVWCAGFYIITDFILLFFLWFLPVGRQWPLHFFSFSLNVI